MSPMNIFLILVVTVLATAHCNRMMRSPGKMEVDVPSYSPDHEAKEQEYQDKMSEEEQYLQGEGQKYDAKYEEAKENRDKNAEKIHEQYEKEKEYRENRQENDNEKAEEVYNNNKDRLETEQHDREEHYHQEHPNYNNIDDIRNKTNEEINKEVESKGERYEGKGKENLNEREQDMENIQEKGPSFTYERD